MSQKSKETYIQSNMYLKGTKELKGAKICWKSKTYGNMAQYLKHWKSYRKSILKFAARKTVKYGTIYWKAKKFQKTHF